MSQLMLPGISYCYRPRSVASEGYVFTGICLSNEGGGGDTTKCIMYRSHGQVGGGPVQKGGGHPPRMGQVIDLPPPLKWDRPLTSAPPPHTHTYGNCGQCAGGTHPTGMHTYSR